MREKGGYQIMYIRHFAMLLSGYFVFQNEVEDFIELTKLSNDKEI